ncbi:EamA family transporter RarD [Sporomusa sphaeroides]|uniref:EamA-like transporter family protein n=1 Tax=Sporomusa sphaeroides DSM 2875 TaxID=1337886 RepID=A0ABM9W647_9FIRM|nr:EamA family transporter RarD [Sporomusa sphaeroides]OLS57768.1 EamA-like transporter family protein [Sporomusa sphaeroides DSM 2875]CVK20535.1 EamA-like transporter family protein [Sporomusa sphaeroides DSM 2875]
MQIKTSQQNERLRGIILAVGAYCLWGILPIYWKQLPNVSAYEILAHRVVWSFFFMFAVILTTRSLRQFLDETKQICRNRKKLGGLFIVSTLISINWWVYIWAVNASRIVETSLGYYINPLVSVLLGIIVLKEKLSLWQTVSFMLAAVGVLTMTINFGAIPWVSLWLAFTFAFYGMCKKILAIGAVTATTLETLIVSPFAVAYLLYVYGQGGAAFSLAMPTTAALLMGAGAVTAIPLLLFAGGANRLPLSLLGFIQYLSPTISLTVGVLLYHEPFTSTHLVSFSLIWLALGIFSLARTKLFIKAEERIIGLFKGRQEKLSS